VSRTEVGFLTGAARDRALPSP